MSTMRACGVALVGAQRICATVPARTFLAYCACGHEIEGCACEPCLLSARPGCMPCWRDGDGHECPVEFDSAACLCGCGENVEIAVKGDRRYGQVRGRPRRYLRGHNNALAVPA